MKESAMYHKILFITWTSLPTETADEHFPETKIKSCNQVKHCIHD